VQTLIPEISCRGGILNSPTMDLPSRIVTPQLGMRAADLDDLDQLHENKKQEAIKEAVDMQNKWKMTELLIDMSVFSQHNLRLMTT
jgi:hypothetical protein